MFQTLKALVKKDKDLPERAHILNWREQFRTSAIYENLGYAFREEKSDLGEYIPLHQRRPSVEYGLPMIIVNDTTSLLFSEGHFPTIDLGDDEERETFFTELVKTTKLKELMLDAAVRGSVGSIAIKLEVLKGRVFFKVMPTRFLTPTWDREAPDELVSVTEKYKVKGAELIERGYAINERDKNAEFWFQRVWDREREIWYLPWPVLKIDTKGQQVEYSDGPKEDEARTVKHALGFVPLVWIKNLPGGDDIDGACTFEPALKNSIEIDYQLSQGGRGLKYSSDPTLHIREPAFDEQTLIKSGNNAIKTGPEGDVKILEISGTASAAVLEYVRFIREISLELCGGNRASPEKLSGAQSGRAMELMNQGLIWLADKLRTSYGEHGLTSLLRMVIAANEQYPLIVAGKKYPKGKLGKAAELPLTLKWPPWYAPTASDHQSQAAAIKTYRDAGVLSRETAVKYIQHDFDVEDVDAELNRISDETKEQAELDARQAPKVPTAVPAKAA
jgi:Phage portal protein, SPP1 Gp6-like